VIRFNLCLIIKLFGTDRLQQAQAQASYVARFPLLVSYTPLDNSKTAPSRRPGILYRRQATARRRARKFPALRRAALPLARPDTPPTRQTKAVDNLITGR